MKKILIPLLLLVLPIIAGLWWLVRRGPVTAPPEETTAAFHAEPFGNGVFFRYSDEQTPLRALRWLTPQPDGLQALQVVTQSDRQRLVIFKDAKQVTDLLIPRPAGIREGFFNFAELPEAIVLPDVAILLYRSANPSTGELPLVVALDIETGALRWVHRGAGEHIALASDPKDGAVFLYGPTSPVTRLPLALQKGEHLGTTPFRSTVKAMEMPEEVKTIFDFLPTGPWSFLLAHSNGLSAFSGSKGWNHCPMPSHGPLTYSDDRSVLAASKGYWWQPFPGKLLQVKADGTPMNTEANIPEPDEPWSKDRGLLRLMGADPHGYLWFSLAAPVASSLIATPQPARAEEPTSAANPETAANADSAPKPETAQPLANTQEWSAYLALGLNRTYRWHPDRHLLQPINVAAIWAGIALPPGMNRPTAFPDLRPASGALIVEAGSTAWRVPLEVLIKSSN